MSHSARTILSFAAALALGCDGGGETTRTGSLDIDGTVASLSPGSNAPAVLSLQWFFDQGTDEGTASGGSAPVPVTLPAKLGLTIAEPTRFLVDLEALGALPSCQAAPMAERCWDGPKLTGKGKVAIGSFLVFEDTDGNGQFTQKPKAEPVRGHGPVWLIYTKDLDAQGMKEFGELKLVNPQALRPGFNFARIRCRDKVGWTKSSFDPFEIVPAEAITVESMEVFRMRQQTGELCTNWT